MFHDVQLFPHSLVNFLDSLAKTHSLMLWSTSGDVCQVGVWKDGRDAHLCSTLTLSFLIVCCLQWPGGLVFSDWLAWYADLAPLIICCFFGGLPLCWIFCLVLHCQIMDGCPLHAYACEVTIELHRWVFTDQAYHGHTTWHFLDVLTRYWAEELQVHYLVYCERTQHNLARETFGTLDI